MNTETRAVVEWIEAEPSRGLDLGFLLLLLIAVGEEQGDSKAQLLRRALQQVAVIYGRTQGVCHTVALAQIVKHADRKDEPTEETFAFFQLMFCDAGAA